MSKRKTYNLSYKLKAVAATGKKSKEAVAREFGVDAKRIREWCKQKEKLLELKKKGKSKRRRLTGGGRKAQDEDMEDELFDWISGLRSRNLRVSYRMIREKAKELSNIDGFSASKGWLQRFIKRKGLTLRRKTTVCQSTPANYIPKLIDFIGNVRRLRINHGYSNNCIFAMDETACWMDMPSDTTVDTIGARSIPIKTTGHEKSHYTVILTAKADGTKLKPYIVFKGKGTRLMASLKTIPGVVVRFSKNGWMNDSLTIDYLDSIIGRLSFGKRLLVWDAYRCHISEAVKGHTSQLRLDTAIVPGGCTKFIQGPDVVWNKIFKSSMENCYDTWLSCPAAHQYTKGGNLKAASRPLICDWVKSSWQKISQETIKASFVSCAITTSTDGSDDDKIHCFKEGQPCAEGRRLLDEKMQALLANVTADAEDPFADDEDDEETEINELVIDQTDCCDEGDVSDDGDASDDGDVSNDGDVSDDGT